MTPLQRLIEDVRDSERGLSYAKLAKRSERPDGSGGLSRGRLQQLATQPVRRGLDIETREALARALRMPPSVINDALSLSVGTFSQPGEDIETRRLLALVSVMPSENRARWFRLARALADALAAEHGTTEEQSSGDELGRQRSLAVRTDRFPVSHGEQIVQADGGELTPQTDAEREYVDTLSDAALDRLRARLLGE